MKINSWGNAQTVLNERVRETAEGESAFLIHYWGATPDHRDNPVHRHSFYEVCYVLGGEGTYEEEKSAYPLRKGTLFLSRPWKVHQIRSDSGLLLLYVAFETAEERGGSDWASSYGRLAQAPRFMRTGADESESALLWRALLNAAMRGGEPDGSQLVRIAHALLSSFLEQFGEPEERRRRAEPNRSGAVLLQQATLFVRDNLAEQLRLEEVAGYLHISGRHLARLFARELGQSFTQYVRRQRVNEAARLLRESDLTIKRIALETGFGSVHYFTRIFTESEGISPGAYRGLPSEDESSCSTRN